MLTFEHSANAERIARRCFRRPTDSERALLRAIRRRPELDSFAFQVATGPYVPDFISHELRALVEVDGSYHNKPKQRLSDARRDAYFAVRGYRTIRFTVTRVNQGPESCVLQIAEYMGIQLGKPRPVPDAVAVDRLRKKLRKKRKGWPRNRDMP